MDSGFNMLGQFQGNQQFNESLQQDLKRFTQEVQIRPLSQLKVYKSTNYEIP